ncbi:hypothetical protein OEW28_02095 [Defluviimonas sp. WL0002]|uniref:Uncharacterized protein n=1 Tax=Albidovulum marisflavi TaxID=2984159 RepID=A0ABT2Z8F8_9RHOB|nr:hypothetical protein [Defluviimonas sp. WL0002]MCV2867419.1 hypothetical protein [Defluviimonas sp. WL0002]
MRILSARVIHARRSSTAGRVDALVRLLSEPVSGAAVAWVDIAVSAPARAPGAAPLRDRLLAAAKLVFAANPGLRQTRRVA